MQNEDGGALPRRNQESDYYGGHGRQHCDRTGSDGQMVADSHSGRLYRLCEEQPLKRNCNDHTGYRLCVTGLYKHSYGWQGQSRMASDQLCGDEQ